MTKHRARAVSAAPARACGSERGFGTVVTALVVRTTLNLKVGRARAAAQEQAVLRSAHAVAWLKNTFAWRERTCRALQPTYDE